MNVRFATDSRVYVQSALQETKVCLKNAFCKIAGMILQTRSGVERKKDEYSAYWRFRQTDGQHDPETEEGRTQSISSDWRQIPP